MIFYDVNKFPELVDVKINIDVIVGELNTALQSSKFITDLLSPNDLSLEHYTDYWAKDNGFHSDQIGYDVRTGNFSALAIYKKDFPIKHFDAENAFRKTLSLIKKIPNVHYSGFFKMKPNTRLDAHVHSRKHLIFHLLLNSLEGKGSVITCSNQEKILTNKGDTLLFDYSHEHDSVNDSNSERIHLVIDFNPFD